MIRQIFQLGWADKGEIGGIEEHHRPLAHQIGLSDSDELTGLEGVGSERLYGRIDQGHGVSPVWVLSTWRDSPSRPIDEIDILIIWYRKNLSDMPCKTLLDKPRAFKLHLIGRFAVPGHHPTLRFKDLYQHDEGYELWVGLIEINI